MFLLINVCLLLMFDVLTSILVFMLLLFFNTNINFYVVCENLFSITFFLSLFCFFFDDDDVVVKNVVTNINVNNNEKFVINFVFR